MKDRCPICTGYLDCTFNGEGTLVNQCIACGYVKEPNKEMFKNCHIKIEENNWIKKLKEDFDIRKDKIIVISYLRSIREKRGLSQKQISDFFAFTEQRYGNVERHYNAPSIVLISHFAYILKTSISELFKNVQISEEMYNEMKYLKIKKSELVDFSELRACEEQLKTIEEKITKVKENLNNINESSKDYIEINNNYIDLNNRFIEKNKEYNKLLNSKDALLKQGEVVDNFYWEKYLNSKEKPFLDENIKHFDYNL